MREHFYHYYINYILTNKSRKKLLTLRISGSLILLLVKSSTDNFLQLRSPSSPLISCKQLLDIFKLSKFGNMSEN